MQSVYGPAAEPAKDAGAGLILVEEIAHRVLNDYTGAIASLRLALERIDDPDARALVSSVAESFHARAETHRVLQAPTYRGRIDLAAYLKLVCASISAASLERAGIRLTFIERPAILSAERCWRMGLVVSELIANAARHGLGGSEGDILVELLPDERGICCRVTDNGRSAAEPAMGRGRRLICSLMKEMGGGVEWFFHVSGVSVTAHAPWDA